jgi:HEAT repeat protein
MVRRDAVIALGDMGDPRQAPLIRKALQDKNPDVRRAAQAALNKLGGNKPAPPLKKR